MVYIPDNINGFVTVREDDQFISFESKKSYNPFGPSLMAQSPEPDATLELQSKVKNLEERLKKLESKSLRESQEERDNESQVQTHLIQ